MGNPLIDLVGPKGYTHGWIYHGVPSHAPRTARSGAHTRAMSAAAARREGGSTKVGARLTMSEAANRASTKLSGRRASDFQHLGAARLHAAAARQAGMSDAAKAHHTRMAAMHRGIAGRTPGTMTRGSSKPKAPPGPAKLRAGETRAPSSGKAAGPNIGELGKAATGSHRLPKGREALTKEGRVKAYSHGHALPPPSPGSPHGYPVTDATSWRNARDAVGRVKTPARREQLKQLLRRTAAQYGQTKALKRSWAASNTRPGLELAFNANEPRNRRGEWTSSGRGLETVRKPAHEMTKAELADHLANFHHGGPIPPGPRGGRNVTVARSHKAMIAAHETQHRLTAAGGVIGINVGEPGVDHAHKSQRAAAFAAYRPGLELAVDTPPQPITGPLDLIISRDPEDGSAVVRHRRGGGEIGRIRHADDGTWRMSRDGADGEPHTRQRGALLELIGAHNHAAPSPYHRQPAPAAEPVPQVAQQTDLMKAYGIPAINPSLANTDLAASTPVTGASDGPRVTTGLGPRGKTIYGKLRGRGFPHARAHSFARRAERRAAG